MVFIQIAVQIDAPYKEPSKQKRVLGRRIKSGGGGVVVIPSNKQSGAQPQNQFNWQPSSTPFSLCPPGGCAGSSNPYIKITKYNSEPCLGLYVCN